MEDGRRTIKASEFKAECLKLMDEVAATGEEIVITKNGSPVSALVPYRRKPTTFFGRDAAASGSSATSSNRWAWHGRLRRAPGRTSGP